MSALSDSSAPPPPPDTKIKLNASPSKRTLLTQAQFYSPDVAIFETIDNPVDQWRAPGSPSGTRPLDVGLHFTFENGVATQIRVLDNGGGVATDRLEALVKAGSENPNENAIGVWGQGLKVACWVLANNAVFRTRHRDGPVYRIDWDKSWWAKPDWDLYADIEPASELPSGSFEITLTELKAPPTEAEVFGGGEAEGEPLIKRLARTYAPLLSSKQDPPFRLTLYNNGVAVPVVGDAFGDPARIDEVFAFPPGFEPTIHTRSFGPWRKLRARAIVGLLPEQNRDLSGVTMYGKGRLFVQALKEGAVGFGTRGAAMIPASHPTTWRLLVLINFDGDSALIPWRGPTKEGYAEGNPHSKEIKAFIAEIAAPYAAFTRVAKRLDVLPYSKMWQQFEEVKVQKEVRSHSKSEEAIPELFRNNPQLAAPAYNTTLIEVNHDRDAPMPQVPSLNPGASRAIATMLARREPHDPKLWSPQEYSQAIGELAAPARPSQPAAAAGTAEMVKTTQIADKWRETRAVTVRMPLAVIERVEGAAPRSVNAWIVQAIEQRLGREVDPLLAIPAEAALFRPPLDFIREKILARLPDVKAIGLFGSVARGSADRASDIDLLVVHEDRAAAQRAVNELLKGFRFPALHGDRYDIRPEVINGEKLDAMKVDPNEKVRKMMAEAIWLHGGPA